MAYHPEMQHIVADMRIGLDAAQALLERTCADWAAASQHPDWPVRLTAARSFVIDQRLRPSSIGRSTCQAEPAAFKRNRLEQIFRDVRMGRFHPGNTHARTRADRQAQSLGIDPDSPQRWG
jgi:alkylation response protein AidB-like acyl-CoA dehydrogenase